MNSSPAIVLAMLFVIGNILFGCAHQTVLTEVDDERQASLMNVKKSQLEILISDKEFNEAIQLLSFTEDHGAIEYQGKALTKERLLKMASEELAAVQREAQTLMEKQRWREAEVVLADLQSRMPLQYLSDIDIQIREIKLARTAKLAEEALETSIQYGQWLSQVGQYYELELANRTFFWSINFQVKLNRVVAKQNRLAKLLLDEAVQAISNEDYLVANRIYGTLAKFRLNPSLDERYVRLGYQILERVELIVSEFKNDIPSMREQLMHQGLHSAAQDQNAVKIDVESINIKKKRPVDDWVLGIAKMIKEGRLIEINSLLARLEKESLNEVQSKQVKSARRYLHEQIEMLDSHADRLYSRGNISKAHSIWALLRQLDRKNDDVRLKYNRSSRVLGNMQELRQEGFYSKDVRAPQDGEN